MSTISSVKLNNDVVVSDSDEAYDEAIKKNTLASVDSTTGKSDAQVAQEARVKDMDEKRLLDASEDQRKRGISAASAIRTPVDPLPVAPAGTASLKLSDLDPYLKA